MNEVNVLKNIEILEKASDSVLGSMNSLSDVLEILEKEDNAISRLAIKAIEQSLSELSEANSCIMRNIYSDNGDDERNDPLSKYRSYFGEDTGTWYDQAKQAYYRLTGFTASNWDVLAWTTLLFNGYTTADYLLTTGSIEKNNGQLSSFAIEHGELCSFAKAKGYDGKRIKQILETKMAGLTTPIFEPEDKASLGIRKKAHGLV